MFTETNPDNGTETKLDEKGKWGRIKFTETNPDKGTETGSQRLTFLIAPNKSFTETNPDKGTETAKRCKVYSYEHISFTEINPDKGTETLSA